MNGVVDAQLLEEMKGILRRDLKLGADAKIADDMPLIGGEMDLDSLDILLVVSSIEKHFGIKIPNEVVGRSVFKDVSTLARYVQENREVLKSAKPQAAGGGERDWLALLPHGKDFRFVSKVNEVLPGVRATGVWMIDGSESFFAGHFPGRPVVPGVLLIEALAQVAGLASSAGEKGAGGVLAHADVRFEEAVVPPAAVELRATVSRSMGAMTMSDVIASVAGRVVARGTVAVKVQ